MNILSWLYTAVRGVPAGRLLGRITAGTGRAEALAASDVRNMIDVYSTDEIDTALGLIGGGEPGGSSGQVQFNSADEFAGFAGLTIGAGTDNVSITSQGSTHTALNIVEASGQSAPVMKLKTSAGVTWCQLSTVGIDTGRPVVLGPGEVAGTSNPAVYLRGYYAAFNDATCWQLISKFNFHDNSGPSLNFSSRAAGTPATLSVGNGFFTGTDYISARAASPGTGVITASGGIGTNIAGGTLIVAGGRGTGTGAAGPVVIQTAPAGSSGTTNNTLVDAGKFDATTTAGNTRFLLYDVDKGALSRVSVGANDSGGAGYKVLRVEN